MPHTHRQDIQYNTVNLEIIVYIYYYDFEEWTNMRLIIEIKGNVLDIRIQVFITVIVTQSH